MNKVQHDPSQVYEGLDTINKEELKSIVKQGSFGGLGPRKVIIAGNSCEIDDLIKTLRDNIENAKPEEISNLMRKLQTIKAINNEKRSWLPEIFRKNRTDELKILENKITEKMPTIGFKESKNELPIQGDYNISNYKTELEIPESLIPNEIEDIKVKPHYNSESLKNIFESKIAKGNEKDPNFRAGTFKILEFNNNKGEICYALDDKKDVNRSLLPTFKNPVVCSLQANLYKHKDNEFSVTINEFSKNEEDQFPNILKNKAGEEALLSNPSLDQNEQKKILDQDKQKKIDNYMMECFSRGEDYLNQMKKEKESNSI